MKYLDSPAYLKAANVHAVASDNTSIFEDVADFIGKTPDFLVTSIASGANSFYNTGVAVGNIFQDADNKFQENDTGEWISSLDEDWGRYYQEHKTAADVTGFIAGSLIPGILAVKGLRSAQGAMRIAQAGQVGKNTSLATRLLAPSMETFVKREAGELAARSSSFSFMHANSLKALASGTQQAVLESLAFETAVAATMFKSPLLEDMDFGDIVKNGLIGVALGGVVGAVGSSALTYFGVRNLTQRADRTASLFSGTTQLTTARGSLTSDRIVQASADLAMLDNLTPTPEFVLAQKVAAGETGESLLPNVIAGEVGRLQRLKDATKQDLQNKILTESRKLAGGDDELGVFVTGVSEKLGPDGLTKIFFNAEEITRPGKKLSWEESLKQRVATGEFKNLAQARKRTSNEATVQHIRLHSGSIGEEVIGKYGVHRLADDFDSKQIQKLISKNEFKPTKRGDVDFRKLVDPKIAELSWLAARSSSLPLREGVTIGSHDLPMLEKAIRDGISEVKIKLDGGNIRDLASPQEIKDYFMFAKSDTLVAHRELNVRSDVTEIVSDIRKEFIEGTAKDPDNIAKHFSAQESYAREASDFFGREISARELHTMPSAMKVTYNTQAITDDAGMIMKGMEVIKHREKLAKQATDRYFASYAGELGLVFPEITEDLLRSIWRGETGPGLLTNASAQYGSMSSMASFIGDLVSELTRTKISALTEDVTATAQKLLANSDDAVRFSALNAQISNAKVQYVLSDSGEALIPYVLKQAEKSGSEEAYIRALNDLPENTIESIPIPTEELRAAVAKHIELSDKRNIQWRQLNAVQGNTDEKLDGVFRPIRPDPRDYKHIAFVKDESITGVGHTKMLFANTAEDLEAQIAKVEEIGKYKVYTKNQTEAYFKARGEYEWDKTIHENYIDSDLRSRGIQSNFLPATDPAKIVDQWLQQHVRQENTLIKQSVVVKYEKEINELKRLAEQWDSTKSSVVGRKSIDQILAEPGNKNPYSSMIKQMMNITGAEEGASQIWNTLNQSLDRLVSQTWNKAWDAIRPGATDEAINNVNRIFEEYGFRSAYYDSASMLLANSKVPRGVLSKFVRTANAFLTTTVLRLDFFNSINNLVGNSVLYSAELKGLTDAIKKGSTEGAGELAKLAGIKMPGVGDEILSPVKLMANSLQRLHGPNKDALIAEYKLRGLLPDLSDQYFRSLDPLTLSGAETVADFGKKTEQIKQMLSNFAKQGEKWTGNKFSEEFNRLLAADAIKQITEVAVKNGILDEKTAWAYVGTFSKRVNGVIRAAERPLLFQGPIGQAMGLFQSYQINLMQQLFRNIGEGRGKVVALMAGMQGSIYGASSLPGLNYINTNLVGNAAGNPEHYDLYTGAQAVFGKTGADWLMYGAPSNILRASLFTRGNTNPRTWSIVPNPTNPSEIPFISAFGKVFTSIKSATNQAVEGGGIWNSFLYGLEHMGLSRPLAGLAQTARAADGGKVFATATNGDITGSNDLVSMATLVRLAGAKPIDEAITTNAFFRIKAYQQKDAERKESMGTAIKTAIQDGQEFTSDEVGEFARKYVEYGGSVTGFNQWWMNQYKNASVPQTVQMVQKLDNPYARRMMEVMGGRESLFDVESF